MKNYNGIINISEPDDDYSIYIMYSSDENDNSIYVGVTKNPKQRVYKHSMERKRGMNINKPLYIWLNDLLDKEERSVIFEVIEEKLSEEEAFIKEIYYIEKYKSHPHYETFLFSNINMASIYAQMDLKNYQSYLPIEGSEGMIYIIDGKINISFPFKAQNGYGNMIFMKAYYSMKFVNGKTETTHFVN
jgi:predicted GIY-YIG superfamily endonuclease